MGLYLSPAIELTHSARALLGAVLIFLLAACPGSHVEGRDAAPGSSDQDTQQKVYADQLPGVATGRVERSRRVANTRAMNAALARGAILYLRAGSRIEIGSALIVPSGAGIVGEARGPKPIIFMPAEQFSNEDNSFRSRYADAAVGINFSGNTSTAGPPTVGVRLQGFILQAGRANGRRIRGIVGRHVADCLIRGVEVTGFPTGVGIALASAKRCTLDHIYIHDFADDAGWKQPAQITGIEIDNDRVSNVASAGIVIRDFLIENLRVTGPLLEKWGHQTDGINIAYRDSRVRIVDGRISGVGEGIDTFGSLGSVENVSIENTMLFGLKFVHGASRNRVNDVTVINSGLAGMAFSGSNMVGHDTAENVVTDLTIRNIDPVGSFRQNSTAGILVIDNGGTAGKPRNNLVVNASIDLGRNGKYGWLDTSTGSGNRGMGIEVHGTTALTARVLILKGGGEVTLRDAAGQ